MKKMGEASRLDVVATIAEELHRRQERLPQEVSVCLMGRPRVALRLLKTIKELADDQYVEFHYSVQAESWSADAEGAQDNVRDELEMSVGNFQVRWTGRWRVSTYEPDHWAFLQKMAWE